MEIHVIPRIIAVLILSGFVIVFNGCSLNGAVDATDFSGVYVGMFRSDFEKLTGRPIELSEFGDCVEATYEYDRGYVGCVASGRCRELSAGEEAFGYVSYAAGTIMTAGAIPWMVWYETNDCQTGYLRTCYGSDNRLISIKLLDPRPYKDGTYLWDKDLRKPWLRMPCRHVYTYPQPCTIPPEVLDKDEVQNPANSIKAN